MNTFLTPSESNNTWWFDGSSLVARSVDGELKTIRTDPHKNFELLKAFDARCGPITRSANKGRIVWNYDGVYILQNGEYVPNDPPYPIERFDKGLVETSAGRYLWRGEWVPTDVKISEQKFAEHTAIPTRGRNFWFIGNFEDGATFEEHDVRTGQVLTEFTLPFHVIAYMIFTGWILTDNGQVYSLVGGFIDEIHVARQETRKSAN